MEAPSGWPSNVRHILEGCGMKTSRTSSLRVTAPRIRPSGSSVGRSFKLCTARSIRSSRSACSISFVNSPLSPIADRGESRTLSPVVLMISTEISNVGSFSRNADATQRACHRARSLPRLPMRTWRVSVFMAIPSIA